MSWVERAEKGIADGAVDPEDRLVRGRRGALLDPTSIRALLAPFLAALVWAAAIFRELVAGTPIDPIAFALRVVALGLTLRVFLLGAELFSRLSIWWNGPRYALVLTPEGLFYRTPQLDIVLPRDQVIGIVEEGHWHERGARKWSSVFVVTDPASGRTHFTLPPVFDDTPGRLAERLMRWRGGWDDDAEREFPAPHALASKVYDDAAQGKLEPGITAVRHGRGWLTKGPYFVVLIAATAAEGIARGGPRVWEAIGPAIGGGLVVALLAVFARWLWMTRREVAPQKGLSMVITPAELLLRAPYGLVRTQWSDIVRTSVTSKRAWSVLEGMHDARQLVITRRGEGPIRYDEPYLGLPAEVAQLLLEAYRTGRLPSKPPERED